jgi:hypothetical protein
MALRQVGVHQNTATRFGELTGAEGSAFAGPFAFRPPQQCHGEHNHMAWA